MNRTVLETNTSTQALNVVVGDAQLIDCCWPAKHAEQLGCRKFLAPPFASSQQVEEDLYYNQLENLTSQKR